MDVDSTGPGAAYSTIAGKTITDAINEGAIYKFLTKPWEDDLLRANIEEAFRYKELADENRRLSAELQVANLHLARANEQTVESLIVWAIE